MKKTLLFILLIATYTGLKAHKGVTEMNDPLEVVRLIGDKLLRDTPFKYRLTLPARHSHFDGLHFIDFGRSFGTHQPAVAYAFTQLTIKSDTTITIQIAHNDGCKIWINGLPVYERVGKKPLDIRFEERSVEMTGEFAAALKKGNNPVLVKSETYGEEWVVVLQPPGLKGAVVEQFAGYPEIGLKSVPYVDTSIARLTNWLVIGPFGNTGGTGMQTVFAPEQEMVFGKMYEGAASPVTWTIPKVEIIGDIIDPLPWGTNYNWNYHNGGVAWAMQHLAEVTGDARYNRYASGFCDFHLNGSAFVEYQVQTLRAVNSANNGFLFSPLLDFTLAPALPFIYRLRKEPFFENRNEYEKFIERMIRYALEEQVRLPGSGIYTRLTPEKYTTWVDDMFMGIPFLIQAAQYVSSPEKRKILLDDAAGQIKGFIDQVWDSDANLYMHARYSGRTVKLPHWSRANGWGIWAVTEVLKVLPENHPEYKTILHHYRKHVNALVALQNHNGFWHQLLDRPDSREEVSGTAIFTMAIARGINHGWLNRAKYTPYAMKGWEAIKSQTEPDGTVHNICYGTMCSEDERYYLERPFYDNDTHGLFAVLFAGMEVHLMMRKFPGSK